MNGCAMPFDHPHSLTPTPELEERERSLRLQGGNVVPFEYKNPFSWPSSWRFGSIAAGLVYGTAAGFNHYQRRPKYAGFFLNSVMAAGMFVVGYVVGNFRDAHYATRDAIVEHYKSLHPRDFDYLRPENARRFNELLLPWYPVRLQQSGPIRKFIEEKAES